MPFSVFSSSRWIGSISPERNIETSANLSPSRVLRSHGMSSRSRPCQSVLISSSLRTRSRGCYFVKLRQVDARRCGDVVAARFRRPIEQGTCGTAHMAGVGRRRLAELTGDDVVRQLRDVVLGDLSCEFLAEPGADEVA